MKKAKRFYISYGSNLCFSQMRYRCPAAKPICGLILPDSRLVFRGVADVEDAIGETAPGGLWTITEACEAALDSYEGIGSGLYWKDTMPVELPDDGGLVEALIYRMTGGGYERPSRFYVAGIRAGYNDFGLDEAALDAALAWSKAAAQHEPRWRPAKKKAPAIGVTGA